VFVEGLSARVERKIITYWFLFLLLLCRKK